MTNLIDKCAGCGNIGEAEICKVYSDPPRVWTRLLGCPMRSHSKSVGVEEKAFADPLKASKKRARGVR